MNSNQTNFSNRHASSSSIRQSNFELLRIISMILIIAAHFSYHGGFNFTSLSINFFWIQFLNMGGKVSVNIFILISGYFLINATKIKIKKILLSDIVNAKKRLKNNNSNKKAWQFQNFFAFTMSLNKSKKY